jgi:hypothetical protein
LQENSRAANSPGLNEAGYSKSRLRVLASVASLALNFFFLAILAAWRGKFSTVWKTFFHSVELLPQIFPQCGKNGPKLFHCVEKWGQSCSIVWKINEPSRKARNPGKQEKNDSRKDACAARSARSARRGQGSEFRGTANSPGLNEAGYSKSRLRVLASVASFALKFFFLAILAAWRESFPASSL